MSDRCLIIFASATKAVNSKYLLRVQHKTRIFAVSCCIVTSFFIIAMCCFYDSVGAMFFVSLLASIIVGVGSALGEATNLGFLKTFPGDAIGYYGSGTGFAGISGAAIFLILYPLGFTDGMIFLVAIPTAIPYFLCFNWLNNQKKLYPYESPSSENQEQDENATGLEQATYDTQSLLAKSGQENLENVGVHDNLSFTWVNVKGVLSRAGLLMSNLSLVYFLEYTITMSFTVAQTSQIKALQPGRDQEFVY